MEYFEPKSISEALSVLVKHGAEAKVIAGGTDVMVDIKFKEEPGSLVNIKKLPGMSGPPALPQTTAHVLHPQVVHDQQRTNSIDVGGSLSSQPLKFPVRSPPVFLL